MARKLKRAARRGETRSVESKPAVPAVAPSAPEPRSHRRAPVPNEEIVARLNELLEAERAGVEAAASLKGADTSGMTDADLKKFGDDEAWACAGLTRAVLQYGGVPSDRTGDFGRKVAALRSEGERLSLMARGQAWVVKRLDALLAVPLDQETRAFLAEMREQHLENIEACNRRAEELEAPPSPPYRPLPLARLREAHDRLYFGRWRTPGATERDLLRTYAQLDRYLGLLAEEVQRSRSLEARRSLTNARRAYEKGDPQVRGTEAVRNLDNALSFAHSALNSLLQLHRTPSHNPADFESFYDVVGLPFGEVL